MLRQNNIFRIQLCVQVEFDPDLVLFVTCSELVISVRFLHSLVSFENLPAINAVIDQFRA